MNLVRDEIQHVALGMTVDYSGIFNYSDLIVMIDSFFKKKNYHKQVVSHSEKNTPSGRNISLKLRPYWEKKGTKLEIQLTLTISNMVDVVKKIDGVNIKMNKGDVKAVIDCFVLTSNRGTWEARAEYTFIRTIFDKFLFRSKSKDYEGRVKADAVELKNEIHYFLNLNKFLF